MGFGRNRIVTPSWRPQFTACIADSKEEAISIIRTCVDNTQIFCDRYGYKGNIGAAVFDSTSQWSLQFKLGKKSHHMVFEGELVGILLALHLLSCFCNTHKLPLLPSTTKQQSSCYKAMKHSQHTIFWITSMMQFSTCHTN